MHGDHDDEDDCRPWDPTGGATHNDSLEQAKESLDHQRELIRLANKQGFKRGIERGRFETLRITILEVICERGMPLTPPDRARIMTEPSIRRLRSWHHRAITAGSVADILSAEEP